jgi:UDP-glucose:(heptosyl)LPS alpha-1,3-glucosyltransferase
MLVVERFDASVGGLEAWTVGIASYLLAQGHDVHVAATTFAAELPVVAHRLTPARLPSELARNVAELTRRANVDIVHDVGYGWTADVFHPQVGSRVLNLARDVGSKPLLARWRLQASPAFRRWRRDLVLTEQRQIAAATRIVAVSDVVRTDLMQLYDIAPERIVVVRNGIDVDRFAPAVDEAARREARAALGVASEVLFLAAAHNFRLKGLDLVLEALASIARAGGVRLVVAGSGAIAEYRAKAARLRVGSLVSFAGQVGDMARLYAAADVFVHPTFHDACSLATLEALAGGLPVITTRVNGAADCMQDGREGYLLDDPHDVGALSAAMTALLATDHRLALGRNARALGKTQSFAANCAAVAAAYADVLASVPDRAGN